MRRGSSRVFLFLALYVCVAFAQGEPKSIQTISRESIPSVVLVVTSDSFGKDLRQGSGFVVRADGLVVTNYHLVSGASSAIAKFPNGAFFKVSGVLSVDPKHDLALIKLAGRDLPAVPLAESDKSEVGEEVVAIGSPHALESTVSNGIISGVREIGEPSFEIIQTTAPISPGSSGGPLFNMNGQVIGVTSFQLQRGQNLNFAVPIRYVRALVDGASDVIPLDAESDYTSGTLRTNQGGVLVAGYRSSNHIARSSLDVFTQTIDGIVLHLLSRNVRVIGGSSKTHFTYGVQPSVIDLLQVSKKVGAEYLVFVNIDRPWTQWIKVTIRGYDLSGNLLWEETASEGGGMTGSRASEKVIAKLARSLEKRIGQPGLPTKDTNKETNKEKD